MVWVPLSVPHKHVKYLMQGLIEVEVYNVVFFNGCYRIEKREVFQDTRKWFYGLKIKSCCVAAPVQTKFLSARANCQSEVSAFLQGRLIQYIHQQQSQNLYQGA